MQDIRYIRKKGAARYLDVTERTLSRLMNRRAIPFIRVSRRIILFDTNDLDRVLQKYRIAAVGED
jgi:excisionase family DNA binding protein